MQIDIMLRKMYFNTLVDISSKQKENLSGELSDTCAKQRHDCEVYFMVLQDMPLSTLPFCNN